MSDKIVGNGNCLCGSVSFTATNINPHVGACHCSMCRKWGGPYMEVDCGTEIAFEGSENITVYDSSPWAERGFCKKCGSNLFYRLKETQHYLMQAGLFDADSDFVFALQVFIDEKPEFYAFANKTEAMTGAEVFAKYAPPPED